MDVESYPWMRLAKGKNKNTSKLKNTTIVLKMQVLVKKNHKKNILKVQLFGRNVQADVEESYFKYQAMIANARLTR